MVIVKTGEKVDELISAGGDDPLVFDWNEAWYPLHYTRDLDKSQPKTFTLLNQDLVIWWDKAAACWRVFEDKCPHRLVPLSEGRINEQGLLECPYHGWSFAGSGQAQCIPQQTEGTQAETSRRACVRSFVAIERQGLLFVYAGNPANADRVKLPLIEPMEENPDAWICIDTFRDLPYDCLTLLENVLDASHVPFTHHNTIGKRSNAAPVELEILSANKNGFTGTWAEGPRKGTLGRQDTVFIAPTLMWHDLTSKQFGRTLTVVYATPIRKGECRVFARFPFQFASKLPAFFIKMTPRWYSHIGQNAILEDDQIFLHLQERYLAEAGGTSNFNKAFYLPTKADLFVFEFRQWIDRYNADPFPNEPLPRTLTKEELLERYRSHVQKCSSCREALKTIKQIKFGAGIISAIAWIIAPAIAIYLGQTLAMGIFPLISLMFGGIWLWLGKLEGEFYQGKEIPPRNLT
jgi:phenylpropionate dioxygenase-like ring-hydroxylating dioxygenase large terminal subunit